MKRIYISGPMTGIDAMNFVQRRGRPAARHGATSRPSTRSTSIRTSTSAGINACAAISPAAPLTCDTLALLDGWQKSAGAHLEMHVAHRVGMEIVIASEVAPC